MAQARGMTTKTKAKIGGTVVLAVLVIIIILQNRESVTTEILFIDIPLPRAVLLLITLLIGIAIGMLISVTLARRNK